MMQDEEFEARRARIYKQMNNTELALKIIFWVFVPFMLLTTIAAAIIILSKLGDW